MKNNLQQKAEQLIAGQTANWEPARRNYAALENIETKTLDFNGFSMIVQFNPERVRSTKANIDRTITRPCFLCAKSRAEQESVDWRDYDVLVNPYPIFNRHLTIARKEHIPQYLTGHLPDMVCLSEELPGFVITFNGSRSGASAPDHFHFQAVGKGELPAEKEIPSWKNRKILFQKNIGIVWVTENYLRQTIVVESASLPEAIRLAEKTFTCLTEITPTEDEAQVNALAWRDSGKYVIVFYPRTARRPAQYSAAGDEQFLFSPGVMDIAGVVITVRKTDFERAMPELLADMISQVVPNAEQWQQIETDLKTCLQKNLK